MVSCRGCSTDAKSMGFFKILPKDHLQGEEFMVIPSNFEMKNKVILPNPLFLRLPNDAEWSVSWIKRNYDIWFQQDWKKFALDCSLRDPHFIVFKYEGGSHFEVMIFDVTTYNEIEYSSIRCTNDATKNHYNEVESDNSVEIIEIDDDSDEIVENELHTLLPKKRKVNTKSEHKSDIDVDFDATQKKVSSGSLSSSSYLFVTVLM
ncbi:unnamed protein product [Lupinus luteus]|uniref:TF-B3 domain-containing protein n=1 Tax=Lupinus luteus TaxID=3873 RepID=A0AAV1XAA9_LUPLU